MPPGRPPSAARSVPCPDHAAAPGTPCKRRPDGRPWDCPDRRRAAGLKAWPSGSRQPPDPAKLAAQLEVLVNERGTQTVRIRHLRAKLAKIADIAAE